MKALKRQSLTLVLIAALIVTLTLGIIFAMPARTASAEEEFKANVTAGTEKELKEAVLSAESGVNKKIQLTENIALGIENVDGEEWGLRVAGGRDITLDLNGHRISRANGAWVLLCNVNSRLTLIDTKGGGAITNNTQWAGEPLIYNYGELITSVDMTVPAKDNGGGFTSGNNPAIKSISDSVNFATSGWDKPSVTVTGGTLTGPTQGAIINLFDSNLTVTRGTFVPNPNPSSGTSIERIFSVKTLTINAQAGISDFTAAIQNAQANLNVYKEYRGSTVKVTGGDFTAFTPQHGDMEIDPKIYVGYEAYSTLPGYFVNGDTGETTDNISISLEKGSKWGKDLSLYTPEGQWMELYDPSMEEGPDAEDYYIVSDASEAEAGATVTIGQSTRYYADFTSAFAAIGTTTEDRTIKLCNDAKVEQLNFSKMSGNITLDLNGKKLTIERSSSSVSGHVYFDSRYGASATNISLTVKDGASGGGELILSTPSGSAISTNSFFNIGPYVKFTLESGTIRQTGYFPEDYKETQFNTLRDDEKADEAIFHLASGVEAGAVTIKGGNIVSDICYGTEDDHGELTSSPYLVSWYVDTFEYELNFERGEKYPNKTEIFKFELTDWILNAGKTSAFSWNFKAEGEGAAQWEALGDTFDTFTFSGYGKDYLASNFTEEDNFLGSDGKTYGKLQDAVNGKTGSGYSITVLQGDITVDESVTIDGIMLDLDRNRNFTLILGEGVTLTLTGGATICNGTLQGGVTVAGNATMRDMTITGDVAVNGGTLTIPTGEYQGSFTVADGASLDITGGWFKGKTIETIDQWLPFTLGAYIEAGQQYADATLYEIKIAPNLKAQKWYNENKSKTAFEITSTDDWNAFAIYVSSGLDSFYGKKVTLTAKELDFGYRPEGVAIVSAREAVKPFIPAGNQKYKFNGAFDGSNNTITGIYVTERNAGLFGGTDSSATVNNISVENSVFKAGNGYFNSYNTNKGYVFAGGIIAQGNHAHGPTNSAKGIKLKNITITQEEGIADLMGGGFIGQTWSNLYLEGIEVDGITLDGDWKLGGLVGFTENSVTVIGAKISNYKSLRDGYCVGVVMGHANGGGTGISTHLEDCTILAEDGALIGSMYAGARDADFIIDGPETYIVADKLVDDTSGRNEQSNTVIEFSSEVEEDGVHRTTVILGKGKDEQKLTLADEEGNELPEDQMPQFNEDGSLTARTPITEENRINVSIGGLKGTMQYAGSSGEITMTVTEFSLYDENGNLVDPHNYGEIIVEVTLKFSQFTVGTEVALVLSYKTSGADAESFNFLLTGNQAFVDVEVTATNLVVSVNADGSVSYEGFVGGEDESVLGGNLKLDYVDNGDGTTTVTPSGLESDNYHIVYVSATVPTENVNGAENDDATGSIGGGNVLNPSTEIGEEGSMTAMWIMLGTVAAAIVVLGAVTVVLSIRRRKN